jgi:subtilisin family serine protease
MTSETNAPEDPLSRQEINQIIERTLEETGNFNWNDASDHMLWSALQYGENILAIGYGEGKNDFSNQKSARQVSSKEAIIQQVRVLEEAVRSETQKEEDILIFEDEYLTIIDLKVLRLETVQQLRKDPRIRYMEPGGYRFFQEDTRVAKSSFSSSGCGFDSEVLNNPDFINIAPNARMPWNFPLHNIDAAWAYSTGSGITIGIVDTGLSPNQSLLNGNFNNGDSSGRSLEKYGVYVDSFWPWSRRTDGPDDKCGHGTSMAAAAAAPRNTMNHPVGVAYNANLVSYRAAANVLLEGYHEQRGVARALTELGRRNDVKIISLSMGYIFSVNRIKDAIRDAYSRGNLIFAAGGTSTSFTNFVGVTFPGNMNETVAVTGIEEGSGYNECDTCHKGSKIDFTIIMERSGSNNHVPVLSYYNGNDDYVGGSSVATANAAGIAALIWAKNPGWNRAQILNKMITTSDLYPNRSASFGWGNLDALGAVQ